MKFTKKKSNKQNKKKPKKQTKKHKHNLFFFLQKLITINIQLKGEL